MKRHVTMLNPAWKTLGGGEKYLCVAAEVLIRSGEYDVTFLMQDGDPETEMMARYFGTDLNGVRRSSAVSMRADIAIVYSNFRPFRANGTKQVYVLQTPYGSLAASAMIRTAFGGGIRQALKDLWRRRLYTLARSANRVFVNSEFSARVFRTLHRLNVSVLHPPSEDFGLPDIQRKPLIVSVGRFFRGSYNEKRHDLLIDAFKRLVDSSPGLNLSYELFGSAGDDASTAAYLASLRERAGRYPIRVRPNASYEDLRTAYNEATLFWHAAGANVDEVMHPERVEHFGMTTVEAMSAGCIPVVIRHGGQPEIVSEGKSGFLWESIDQLVEQSANILRDSALAARASDTARLRAREFSRTRFARELLNHFHNM